MTIIYGKKGTTEHTDINKSNTTNEKIKMKTMLKKCLGGGG